MAITKITDLYYVSTGKKNAMYTLRCFRSAAGSAPSVINPDFYVCNLAATEEKATEKAQEYVNQIKERIGESEHFSVQFSSEPERVAGVRYGKLSIHDSRLLDTIELGFFPFGRFANTAIADAPADYLMYFAKKSADPTNNAVTQALSMACLGVALEKGYVAARDAKREAARQLDLPSRHVGVIGERLDFSGQIAASYCVGREDEPGSYWITKIRSEQNVFVYKGGRSLGKEGDLISLRATIYKHDTYQEVQSTVIKRPSVLTVTDSSLIKEEALS